MKDFSSPLSLKKRRSRGLVLFFSVLLLGLVSRSAESRIYILIDQPSEKPFPIAITDLVPLGEKTSKKWSTGISSKIRRDLKLTGLFEFIEPGSFPSESAAFSPDPDTIQFSPWTLIGAQALITGSYSIEKDGVKASLHLYDPFVGQHLAGRSYVTSEKELSVVAHHFADEVVFALTGEKGIFSTRIAYVCRSGKKKEICLMDVDGDNVRRLTHDGSINLSPAWSPSGTRIAYSSYKNRGNPEIFVAEMNGGTRQFTSNGSINVSPTWTPEEELTVATAIDNEDTEIFLLASSGEIRRPLTTSRGIDINPSWSPDGRSFVFASERGGRLHLFRAKADGGEVQRLTFVGYHNDNPAWSPKGDKIVFQGRDEGHWDLFIMNPDGSMLQRLTAHSGNNESPSFSPNGRFITFSSTRNGGPQVFVMREDGSNQTPIGPKEGSTQPAWSPWSK